MAVGLRRWVRRAAIAVALLTVLAVGSALQYRNRVRRTQESVLKTRLRQVRDTIDAYRANKGRYPVSLDALVREGYLRNVPEDPITRTTASWKLVPARTGVSDVKSGAEGLASDGTRYSEW